MTIHSLYGTESVDPLLANDDIIVKENFTAIMITQDQPGHAEINLNCLDGTKLLRNRSRSISIIIIIIQKRVTCEPEKTSYTKSVMRRGSCLHNITRSTRFEFVARRVIELAMGCITAFTRNSQMWGNFALRYQGANGCIMRVGNQAGSAHSCYW